MAIPPSVLTAPSDRVDKILNRVMAFSIACWTFKNRDGTRQVEDFERRRNKESDHGMMAAHEPRVVPRFQWTLKRRGPLLRRELVSAPNRALVEVREQLEFIDAGEVHSISLPSTPSGFPDRLFRT
jgi:hypothetical protein